MISAPIVITDKMVEDLCPVRPSSGHKGMFGRALIYAGSVGMGGAAVMAVSSALRSGAGLVYAATEEPLLPALVIRCPEALGIPIPSGFGNAPKSPLMRMESKTVGQKWLTEIIEGKDACLIGPGIPPDRQDLRIAVLTLAQHACHLVLDAGALALLSRDPELMQEIKNRKEKGMAPAVLTPHLGEFASLCSSYSRTGGTSMQNMKAAGAFAEEKGVILVLKSNETNIFTPDGKWYSNPVSNSGLAKGGSGDVLAGLLSGLLAQGMREEDASVCAVRIHSLAGRLCSGEHGKRAMLPTMLWEYYDRCFKMLKWEEGMENDG
ncbi:MAG: NAD(P)H-hydrate dehydratase [Clostridiales bacterium]|nr:NAD(P)H-hydrate dehydratase [Clostridiales bacterium]